MSKSRTRNIVNILTGLTSFAALAYVVERFWSNQAWKLNHVNLYQLVLLVALGSLFYQINTIFQVICWSRILNWFGEHPASFMTSYSIFGRSQMGKYLPGNVFHLAGRHVLSLQEGYKNSSLLGAATMELSGYLIGSAFLCFFGYMFGLRYEGFPFINLLLIFGAALLGATVLIFILPYAARRIPPIKKIVDDLDFSNRSRKDAILSLLVLFLVFLCYFLMAGLIFYFVITNILGNSGRLTLPVAVSIYSIAYLVGFITPGAPAGIGIRESLMVILLSPYLGESASTLIALTFRLITILGDAIFFLIALFVNRKALPPVEQASTHNPNG